MKSVFIVGAKGIPAKYGGFETFVDELVTRKISSDIQYYVACMNSGKDNSYNGAKCFNVSVPNVGPAKAVLYDLKAIKRVTKIAKEQDIQDGVLYILACRIGPFMKHAVKDLRKRGFKIYVNPDGHEWMRAKWNCLIKKYWKWSEKLMVKNADLLICDSKNIEKYIKKEYANYSPKTTFIPYGADTTRSKLKDDSKELLDWYEKFGIRKKEYYLVLGRFVPENNYETIIREFMKSKTDKDLVLVTNVEKNKFYKKLLRETGFDRDKRIKFVGTVYDKELVKKIRENSFAYIHGHSVGGTNPSLLEALASTDVNILFDCGFNREVAEDGAWYFGLKNGDLAKVIGEVEAASAADARKVCALARMRIEDEYEWGKVVGEYEQTLVKRRRKIMFLHTGAELYGADRILLSIVENINHELFLPVVVLPCDGKLADKLREKNIQVEVISYPIVRRKYFNLVGILKYIMEYKTAVAELCALAREEDIDVIHNNTIAVLEGLSVGRKENIPVISHVHETITHPRIIAKMLYRIALKKANRVVVVSKKTRDYILDLTNGYNKKKLVVVHNGISIPTSQGGGSPKLGLFDKYNIPHGSRVVAMVGRVNAFKGQSDFVKIVSKVLALDSRSNIYAVIVGDAFEGQEWRVDALRKEIEDSGFQDRILYLGFFEDMNSVYSEIDCLVFPSIDYDSFPTVVLEAMVNKKPVVGYRNGGVEEMIINGWNGYLAKIGNIDAVAEKVRMIVEDDALGKSLGENGREFVIQNFSIEQFVSNFENLYNIVGRE